MIQLLTLYFSRKKTELRRKNRRSQGNVRKIKTSELARVRTDLWKEQNFICPLCGNPILKGQEVLDHDHVTGYVRQVLHRQCNQVEGRVLSWITRTGQKPDLIQFLKNVVKYWEKDYSGNPVHPTHLTDTEKEIKRLKKKIRSLKTDKGKAKYIKQLEELQK